MDLTLHPTLLARVSDCAYVWTDAGEPFEQFWDEGAQMFMYSGVVKVLVGEGRLLRVDPGMEVPPGQSGVDESTCSRRTPLEKMIILAHVLANGRLSHAFPSHHRFTAHSSPPAVLPGRRLPSLCMYTQCFLLEANASCDREKPTLMCLPLRVLKLQAAPSQEAVELLQARRSSSIGVTPMVEG
jgi:hypothetical protein